MLETSHKVGKDILEYNTSYIRIMMNVRAVIASPFASMGKKKAMKPTYTTPNTTPFLHPLKPRWTATTPIITKYKSKLYLKLGINAKYAIFKGSKVTDCF